MSIAREQDAPSANLLSGPSLATCLASGRDNFLALRLIAASAVIFGHSYALAAIPGLHDFVAALNLGPGVYSGSLAVDVFFVTSGFLVAGSYIRRDRFWSFAKSRALRLLPAYIVCVSLTALVVGPMFSTLSVGDYYANTDTWLYIKENLKFLADKLRWELPGVFESNPLPRIVNGSLWTLPAEMQMYFWLGLLGLLGVLRHARLATAILLALLCSEAVVPGWSTSFLHVDFLRLAGLFITGTLFYINAERIPINSFILAGLIFACFLLRDATHYGHLLVLTTAYATFWLAYIPRLPFVWLRGDYSYGVYLWGYPCQQMAISLFGLTQPMSIFAISLPMALGLAALSWHYIENPALSLKRRRPLPTQATG
jgi:peptidoglycan/LPS O-acetylase OafA/YrhL